MVYFKVDTKLKQVLITASGRNNLVSSKITFWSIQPLKILTSIETDDDEIVGLKVSPDDQLVLLHFFKLDFI